MSPAGTRGRSLAPALLLAGLLGLWELAAQSGFLAEALGLEPFLVPAPSEVAGSLWENGSLLLHNALITLGEVLAGFAMALALGVATALLLHLCGPLRRAIYPLVVASQAIPVIVVAPVFVIWFGFGIGPKIALVALWCFFPITVAALGGLASTAPEQIKLMRSLGAGRARALATLEAPTALPALMSGARIAAVIAVVGAVFGEWAGGDEGLGILMLRDNAQLEAPRLFASVFVLTVMAVGLFGLLAAFERRFAWWGSAPLPPRLGGRNG